VRASASAPSVSAKRILIGGTPRERAAFLTCEHRRVTWRRKPNRRADVSRIALVAGVQDYEVKYATKKTGRSAGAVKKVSKKVGSSRRK
jgi:hypothetical protein